MRHDLAADPILERRDDLAARRVVLGIGREAELHIERQAHRIALDLDVSFLHDVEQADLHLAGEIGQLIQREDASVRAGQHAVVNGQLVGEEVSTARGLDRIEIADEVRDRHVRGGQLLDVATVLADPRDRCVVACLIEKIAREFRDRRERIVVHLAARDNWNRIVEQRSKRAQNAGLRLAA